MSNRKSIALINICPTCDDGIHKFAKNVCRIMRMANRKDVDTGHGKAGLILRQRLILQKSGQVRICPEIIENPELKASLRKIFENRNTILRE